MNNNRAGGEDDTHRFDHSHGWTQIVVINISSAFDTIQRKNLMDEIELILGEGEQRIYRLLLSNTALPLTLGKCDKETVETNVGSTQGYAISGTLKI